MNKYRHLLILLMALVVLVALVQLTVSLPLESNLTLPVLLFSLLVIFTTTFGAPLTGGVVSLLPMTTAAAFLALGLLPASWLAYFGALASAAIHYYYAIPLGFSSRLTRRQAISLAASNVTLHTTSILASGAIYLILGGEVPLAALDMDLILPFAGFALTYLAMDYVLSSLFLAIRESAGFRQYLKALPSIFIYEGTPLIFAPLVALTYTHLGLGAFSLFTLAVVLIALVMRNLAISRQRLVRQLRELDSLHAVGQALTSSLDLDAVLYAVYQQVARIMPVETFFVALYDEENDEIIFPLVVEDGETVHWPAQRGGRGLAEHIRRTNSSKNRREQTDVLRRAFGMSRSQQPVTSWLGAPILAGDRLMGVITVQSHSRFQLYDASHEEVLTSIAMQAALAIQNAHLYSQTDKALARRVQELDSILNTVREGILLLDLSYRVVALNRALADFLGVAASEVLGASLAFSRKERVAEFLRAIGYSVIEIQAECQSLVDQRENPLKREIISMHGTTTRQVERTLTAVRDRWGVVTGWLIVFRDMSEEVALQELRDDMTHMLVHDLRSPLTVVQSSLTSIPGFLEEGALDGVSRLVEFSQRGIERLLNLVNDILDIARLETGNMPLALEQADLKQLLSVAVEQIAPLTRQTEIEIRITSPDDLPPVRIDTWVIRRVLSNLLDNAIKFTPRGGKIEVWSSYAPAGSRESVWIGVSDSGPGIPPEKQTALFEKFMQIDQPSGRRAGTGLGLHYCKLAVEAHGGKIWVESLAGQGSTFVIQLPATV